MTSAFFTVGPLHVSWSTLLDSVNSFLARLNLRVDSYKIEHEFSEILQMGLPRFGQILSTAFIGF